MPGVRRRSRRGRATWRRPWSVAGGVAAAAMVGGVALAAAVGGLARRFYRVEVAGESMTPALLPGDYLVLRRGPPPRGERAFGRIAAVRGEGGRLLLKRVVGLPGEALRVGQVVQVNGRPLVEPYAHGRTPETQYRGLNRLGEDEYFLAGDNRAASTDSRDFGPVACDAIVGVAVFRYWPPARFGRLATPRRKIAGAPVAGWEALPRDIVGASRPRPASNGSGERQPSGS